MKYIRGGEWLFDEAGYNRRYCYGIAEFKNSNSRQNCEELGRGNTCNVIICTDNLTGFTF